MELISSSSCNYRFSNNKKHIKIDNVVNRQKKQIFLNNFRRNFLLRRLLWMLIIILLIFCEKTNQQQYNKNEKSIITGLLLKKFGLEDLIEPIKKGLQNSKKIKLPSYMKSLYESVENGEHDLIRHHLPTKVHILNSNKLIISYNLTTMDKGVKWIYRADLRIPIHKINSDLNPLIPQKINLYGKKKMIKSKQILKKNAQWINFDVSNIIHKAVQNQTVLKLD